MEKERLLRLFTRSRENSIPIIGAFGYGSSVFKQKGNNQEKSIVDTIFVVKDSKKWHQENKVRNPQDYSTSAKIILGNMNLEAIAGLTGITYQTNLSFEGYQFKYGVISEDAFIRQMEEWDSFFLPGRFQKPVYPIRTTERMNQAINNNRRLALLISLITLPKEEQTLKGLFMNLCSLSYQGDIRMLFVENPNKVANIVEAELPLLLNIYGEYTEYFTFDKNGKLNIDYIAVLDALYQHLPKELVPYLSNLNTLQKKLLLHIKKKNRIESITQPMVGILSVGPINSIKYVRQKMLKRQNH